MKLSLRMPSEPDDPIKPLFDRIDPKIPRIEPPVATKYIQSGHFGKTYLHIDAEGNKKYAVKVINLAKPSINIKELIRNEIVNYYDISHKCPDYFCQFVGFQYQPAQLTIVMDFCGMDFFNYYSNMLNDAKTPLQKKFKTLKSIFKQIAEALQCLHKNGYVHFDLKPENITVKGNKVKLIDAGSLTNVGVRPSDNVGAKPSDNVGAEPSESDQVRVQGTLVYMAPELKHAYLPKYINKTRKNLPSSASFVPGQVRNTYLDKTDIYSYGKMVQLFYPTLFDDEFMHELMHPLPFRRPSIKDILQKLREQGSSGGSRRRKTRRLV